jgi:hypothetical protein
MDKQHFVGALYNPLKARRSGWRDAFTRRPRATWAPKSIFTRVTALQQR